MKKIDKVTQQKQRNKALGKGCNNAFLVNNARRMRNEPTYAEKIFRKILQEKGFEFKEQVPFQDKKGHRYIIDFLVVEKYAVEIDGGYHTTAEQMEKDKERDSVLKQSGFKIKRFTNADVIDYFPVHHWLNGVNGNLIPHSERRKMKKTKALANKMDLNIA